MTRRIVVTARDRDGQELWYYTGKAGQSFMSLAQDHAFLFATKENARNVATRINRSESVHGFWAIAQVEQFQSDLRYWSLANDLEVQ